MSKNLPEAIGSLTRTGKSFENFQNPGTRGSFHSEHIKKQNQRFNRILKTLSQRFLTKSKNHSTTLEKITYRASTKQNKTREI
jgi:hypothetical protein